MDDDEMTEFMDRVRREIMTPDTLDAWFLTCQSQPTIASIGKYNLMDLLTFVRAIISVIKNHQDSPDHMVCGCEMMDEDLRQWVANGVPRMDS